MNERTDQEQLAIAMMRAAERLVFFTGAGISTESGLPDYRGPDGVWTTGKIPSIGDAPMSDEARREFWQMRKQHYPFMQSRQPNEGHLAIARLITGGHALAVITQNIDGLHQKSGVPADRVIELHGSTHRLRCVDNGHLIDGAVVQQMLEAGDLDPSCPVCGSILRSDTILFGESLPKTALETAVRAAAVSDLMIVVGSSLVVYPAAQLPQVAKDRGAKLIIIDRAETALDDLADVVIRGEAGHEMAILAAGMMENA
ncbi:MAG: Sir2 family NAD-dependent protein deacetylase [Thermomicrobiales bacterium]|nr:Sir2 family NAD-dependent protein deacetylase [Thermomicrobiales bacterium]MCO5217492.1 Sir2 family NAD-dependent protein deacetylase [Thermomicrobiales bacterium]MCO5226787.1 Sir2 family NAD-dependent protein deacetylase [Thermomicrobiales bacterium]